MVRSALGKVAWVGRTASMVFGLALVLALVLGVASMALGADGDFFKVGRANLASAASTLDKSGAGPALRLLVDSGPPLAVNSATKVANLNADKIDNKDSTALGVTITHRGGSTHVCAKNISPPYGSWNECARVRVKVPAGKQYNVTALSSFAALSSNSTTLRYCTGFSRPSDGHQSCLDTSNTMSLAANYNESATSSGTIGPLSPGTYIFSTLISPDATLDGDVHDGDVSTRVFVTDASAPGPPIE